jgi:hypothetical protein
MNKENFLFYYEYHRLSLSLVEFSVYCRKSKDAQKTAKASCELVMGFFFVAFLPHLLFSGSTQSCQHPEEFLDIAAVKFFCMRM